MIKEWATVVSWHNGVAQVHCDVKASCSSCASRAGCGSRVLNRLAARQSWQPVILNVALPPDLLRVDTPSSDMGQ